MKVQSVIVHDLGLGVYLIVKINAYKFCFKCKFYFLIVQLYDN